MSKKTEESRIAYNKIASEYDTSRKGQYTRFHIKELSDLVDLSEGDVVLDVACGNGTLLRELIFITSEQSPKNGNISKKSLFYNNSLHFPLFLQRVIL